MAFLEFIASRPGRASELDRSADEMEPADVFE